MDHVQRVLADGGIRSRVVPVGPDRPVRIYLPLSRVSPPLIDLLKQALASSPGYQPVELVLSNAGQTTTLALGGGVNMTVALYDALEALLGPDPVDRTERPFEPAPPRRRA